jgi:chlorite dismutase
LEHHVNDPVSPSVGLGVLHLFCKPSVEVDRVALDEAAAQARLADVQVISVLLLGHKADVAFMVLGRDLRDLRAFQTGVQNAGYVVVNSYLSITEVSEYARTMPEEQLRPRLYPELPPEGKTSWCFYPMSKRRMPGLNWYSLPFDERKDLMHEHGLSGRKFAGRIVQLITASTGLDDYEWGVTLFGVNPDDLKDVVYTMRFDRASANYAEFGPFYAGMVTSIDALPFG